MDLSSLSDADLMAAIAQGGGVSAGDPAGGATLSGSPAAPAASTGSADDAPPLTVHAASPKAPSEMSDAELMAAIGQGSGGGIARNALAGADQALYDTLGAPVDATAWLMNKGIAGVNAAAGTHINPIVDPFGGSASIAKAFGAIGTPDPSTIAATTTGEKLARGVGAGAGYAIAPELATGALLRSGAVAAPAVADAMGTMFGRADTLGSVAGNAVAGGAAGAGATAAEDAVPDRFKPLAGMAGGLAGGIGGAFVAALPRAAEAGAGALKQAAEPLSAGGQEQAAARRLQDAASNPAAVRDALDNPAAPMVPGSAPTTFQATGDMGLGGLERAAATKSPEAFNQRRADQNAARLDALTNLQAVGHPEAVASTMRARLADIDAANDATVQNAAAEAAQRSSALGGEGTPEAYGAGLREALQSAEGAARGQERALWRAVDPDGTLALPSTNVGNAAHAIIGSMPKTAAPMTGEEAQIFGTAATLPPVIPFSDVAALRSRIGRAMRQELVTAGESPAYARLARLRGAIQDDIDGVVAQRAHNDARAVAAGAMAPEDASLSRMAAAWAAKRDQWLSARTADAIGSGDGSFPGGVSASGPTAFAGLPGAAGEGRGGPGYAPSDPGVPLSSNFDDAARDRLSAATDATRDRAQTFGAAPNAAILRRSGQQGPFNMPAAAVPSQIFFPGPKGAAAIDAFRRAAGDDAALGTLQDYAASQLRRAAMRDDGTLNPNTVMNWRRAHADALRSFPALDAKFADAAHASEALADAAGARRQALDAYQSGVVGKLLGVSDPSDVTRTIGSVFGRKDAVMQMQRLATEAGKTPEGAEGLRKAIVDFMTGRLVSNTEAATSGRSLLKADQFQTFVRDNTPALSAVFKPGELKTMQAIADDLQQANRSISAVRLPGGSNTAQDAFAVSKGDSRGSIIAKLALASAAGGVGHLFGGPIAALAATVGTGTVLALRQAGLNRIDDLVRQALLDPETARILLAKAPAKPDTGAYIALGQRVRRAAAGGTIGANIPEQAPTPPATPSPGILDRLVGAAR